MRIEMTTEPGDPQRPNEDYVSATLPASGFGGALVVLDGVTPPEGGDGCVHGVPWFAAWLGGALLELSGSRPDMTLAACLSAAIQRTAEAHRETCDLSHPRTPQATVVVARWDERHVQHLVLSDSALLIENAQGEVDTVLDRKLSELPPHIGALRERVHASTGPEDHATARAAYVRGVEALRNAPDGTGFYTAAADPDVAAHAVTGSTPRAQVRTLLALTDGATRWTETFHLGTWPDLFALAQQEGPRSLISRIRTAESDPTSPSRGKRHDDATALLADLT